MLHAKPLRIERPVSRKPTGMVANEKTTLLSRAIRVLKELSFQITNLDEPKTSGQSPLSTLVSKQ